ncbi:hypothetical protein [Clostridium magnum]|uniref:Uncharacterized protein n=1 Tax=Clostridium magnum DSM 2767 TaxID=1121326 RepID=A0A162S870_9CLOT|nr:hypothetical protein [Clostridium magnum]KZL90899.1 hypothetical protein CLMAG_38100 [Clostridium magnum DSM 2767]SHI12768.1 hypothetical protein SAMN02745944_02644 [Clostridium magnum DSM 2767]
MMSLNFAILKYFTQVNEACADDVTNALKEEYGSFKDLKKKVVITALATAEAIGIIEETRFQLDKSGEVKVYYRSQEEDAANLIYKSN